LPARGAFTSEVTNMATTQGAAKMEEAGGLVLTSIGPSFTVADVEKSIAWYRDVLGFTVGERWEHEGKLLGAELKAGQVSVYLSQDDWKKGRDRAKGEGFRVHCETGQDIDSIVERIRARGGTLLQEPSDEWGSRHFAIADPDGFKITIAKPM
jgi:catechol 2,3-dioxygenase-like lactoylglutathione lyase family enzyme